MDVIKSCGTRVQPLQSVKPIRIAVSTVTDDWKGHTVPLSGFVLKRNGELNGDLSFQNTTDVVGMTLMFPLELV